MRCKKSGEAILPTLDGATNHSSTRHQYSADLPDIRHQPRRYRYQPKLSVENVEIADHLIRLTNNQRNSELGLCFLYLRNEKGHRWNHKRVYRIYCELELNLRIKPKKRIVRTKPEPLAVPEAINQCWSMDFMPTSYTP